MKKLKFIFKILTLTVALAFVGCDSNDDLSDVLSVTEGEVGQKVIHLSTTNLAPNSNGQTNIPYQFSVVSTENVLTSTTVEFAVTLDGAAAIEGVDYEISQDTLDSGTASLYSLIIFYTAGSYELALSNSNNSSFSISSAPLAFKILGAITDVMTIELSWEDFFYDYDLFLVSGNQTFDGSLYGYSGGVSNVETINVPLLWGESSLYVYDFYFDNAGTPCQLTVSLNGSTLETFDVIMDMSKWVFIVDVTPDANDDPVYTFTEL